MITKLVSQASKDKNFGIPFEIGPVDLRSEDVKIDLETIGILKIEKFGLVVMENGEKFYLKQFLQLEKYYLC